ncbi:hypothetical protein H7849_01945 [Alloacidobacterium dinghuense]|uniref:Uncharacterized protein n=1 Tax=Alloacidobacterium dinghuense TaxID=2763107 RepID=A0A7G8BJR7_9BACT|nr:hypothetical protein [Alloacidobacterium dinghuense]QNI32787.1 hypothetical protein H7849_01945 [Alloacidobacterium dinghuense]
MKRLNLFLCAAALVTSTTFAQTELTPGTVSYSIEQNSKKLGTASYTIQNAPNKYIVTSTGKMTEDKFSYAFSNTQKLDMSLNLITDQLSGVVDGKAVSFSASSDPTGRQFKLDISANGTQQNNSVDRNQNAVLLTDLDPAAYMVLANIAMRNPTHSWALIPKENGFLVPVTFSPQPDTQGRLNGQPVSVKYVSAAIGGQNAITIELFYSADGHLLEADLPQQNFYVIRDGFKLTNRPKPPTPPPGQAPPSQDQQSKLEDPQTAE